MFDDLKDTQHSRGNNLTPFTIHSRTKCVYILCQLIISNLLLLLFMSNIVLKWLKLWGRCPHALHCILKWEWWGRYQYKLRTHKPKTYKGWTVQTSDQDKRRTSTNVGPVQTSEKEKRIFWIFRFLFKPPLYIECLIKIYPKELSSCHWLKFSHPYIFAT